MPKKGDDDDEMFGVFAKGMGVAAGAFETGLKTGMIQEKDGQLSLANPADLTLGKLSEGLQVDMNAEGGLDQLFELLGLQGHPKAEEIKVYIRALLQSVQIPVPYRPHILVGQYVTEAATCSQIRNCIEKEVLTSIRGHYKQNKHEYEEDMRTDLLLYLKNHYDNIKRIKEGKTTVGLEEDEDVKRAAEIDATRFKLSSYTDMLAMHNSIAHSSPAFPLFPPYKI